MGLKDWFKKRSVEISGNVNKSAIQTGDNNTSINVDNSEINNSGITNFGEVKEIHQTIIHTPQPTEKKLEQFYKFPASSRHFSQRDNELRKLHELLQKKQCVVVYGAGGLGKTELVNHYAKQHHANYAHSIWLKADGFQI
jgi:dethiobiotin synthetase